ncbi:MAG: SOS response-associated peptidase family protein [Rhodanobacteraceae bacterium]
MCYSAQILQNYNKYVRLWGADVDLDEFMRLYWDRSQGEKLRIPKGMDATFADPHNEIERRISSLIESFDAAQAGALEQEIFKQRKRLADAERKLAVKSTKAANESKRIATDKVAWALGKLADLRRTEPAARDSRIYPGWYAPVMISENGRRVIKPMRYQCRPAGKPAFYDTKYPGCYNARRDSLEKFWKGQYGISHGLVVMNAFYENVSRHRIEGRELQSGEADENVVLEFRPLHGQDMLVACLWSHWQGNGQSDLLSFAAITDQPPPEVAAAGHDRCIIPIKPQNIDAWLNPQADDLATQSAILDDRERPFYEHRMAA